MSQLEKIFERVLQGKSDATIQFKELIQCFKNLCFEERILGSHLIFSKDGVDEIINIQPKWGKAKPYQIKQVRYLILKHRLWVNLRRR